VREQSENAAPRRRVPGHPSLLLLLLLFVLVYPDIGPRAHASTEII